MSEAAPGLPDASEYATPGRARLAASVRALIDTVMTTPDADEAVLLEVASETERLAARLAGGRVVHGGAYRPRSHDDYLPRSPVVGEASPLSPRLDWEAVAELAPGSGRPGIVGTGTFGAAYEGPPGYVHGGWIACAFDEMLGIANILAGHPGMTARLTIHYRRPTPLLRPLRFTAWVDRVEGRRIMSKAQVFEGDVCTAEADGVFVQPRPELAEQYFGPRPEPTG